MKALHMVAYILLWVGGINWGLVGVGNFLNQDWNVVSLALGFLPALESIVYVLVGLSAIYLLVTHKKDCRMCSSGMSSPTM